MPRWLAVTLNLVLFTAAMLVVRWALHETVPGAVTRLSAQIGAEVVLAILLSVIALCCVIGYLGHCPQGQRDGVED